MIHSGSLWLVFWNLLKRKAGFAEPHSSSIRLHPKNQFPGYPASGLKVSGGWVEDITLSPQLKLCWVELGCDTYRLGYGWIGVWVGVKMLVLTKNWGLVGVGQVGVGLG